MFNCWRAGRFITSCICHKKIWIKKLLSQADKSVIFYIKYFFLFTKHVHVGILEMSVLRNAMTDVSDVITWTDCVISDVYLAGEGTSAMKVALIIFELFKQAICTLIYSITYSITLIYQKQYVIHTSYVFLIQ